MRSEPELEKAMRPYTVRVMVKQITEVTVDCVLPG